MMTGKDEEKYMKITYIGHSGFLVELPDTVLLFDYYEGEMPDIPKDKKLLVFASHRHPDHFNKEIFQLAKDRKNIAFILSGDIWKSRVPVEVKEYTVHLKPREEWICEEVEVHTLKSTDEGVAFVVKTHGKTIYHAGDLNDWRWKEESEEWNCKMRADFQNYIEPLRKMKIDAAFVPLDPRQEENYTLGIEYFLELAEVTRVYPMHFWEDFTVIERWLMEHPEHPKRDRIVKISESGEIFEQL